MRDFASRISAVSACGFGLSKAATSIGYLSAMGSVTRNVGFVTELWFMLASEAVSLVLAIVVASLAARGAPSSALYSPVASVAGVFRRIPPERIGCARACARAIFCGAARLYIWSCVFSVLHNVDGRIRLSRSVGSPIRAWWRDSAFKRFSSLWCQCFPGLL